MTMLRVFGAVVRPKYSRIRGLLSFHYGGQKIDNELEQLGNIIQPNSNESLVLRMDKSKTVLSPSYGEGAVAHSLGGPSFAGGGVAMAGAVYKHATAAIGVAGTGIGGDMEAQGGTPGKGVGGTVSDPDGRFAQSLGGVGLSGQGVLTGQPNGNGT